jgi:Ca2+-binding RTX toxin-like protein
MHSISETRRLAGGALAASLIAGALGLTATQADASSAIGLKGKTLVVKGTGASDRLALRLRTGDPSKIEVDVGDNGSADATFARNKVKRIRVKAGRGNDQVRIDDANGAFTNAIPTRIDGQGGNDALRGGAGAEKLNGDAGADTIDGNGGNDIANLGAGDDRFIWDPGDGSDTVEGRKGADTMAFNGSGGRALPSGGQRHTHAADPRRGGHHHGLRRHGARGRRLAGRQRRPQRRRPGRDQGPNGRP